MSLKQEQQKLIQRKDPVDLFSQDSVIERDILDVEMGFIRYTEGQTKLGYLINMHEVSVLLFSY